MSNAMDKYKADLQHLKWGLLALLITLGAGGVVVMLSQDFLDREQKSHTSAQKQLADARKNLATARDDQQNMATYADEYALLLKRNIIGNEQRLDLIDGLEAIRRQNLVLGFKYNIAPQQPYKSPIALDNGNFDINQSGMSLSFDLLHEGQLVNFFNAVRGNIKGKYMLDGCTMERIDNAPADSISPRLKAECKGEWLTLKNRTTP